MNFDVETLLKPISEYNMCGEDLSFSNEFHEIKQAKTQDDVLLDQGDWVTEPKQADWPFVAKKTTELLQNKTKDIRLLTWITEAWAHLYGFEGIEKGLELSHSILEQYWLKIHPIIEDDDLDQRLGLLQGLIGQIPALIRQVPLVNTQPFYNLTDYDKCLREQNSIRKSGEDTEFSEKSYPIEAFEQALALTSKQFQLDNFQKFEKIFVHWDIIKQVLDQLMELEAPSFASVDSQLSDIKKTLKKIYKTESSSAQADLKASTPTSQQVSVQQQPKQEMASMITTQSQYSFQPSPQNHIQNREQALAILEQIATYFKENEPHSPVSYMLQKTIKWSQMPLHEWLNQVIKNDNPLETVQELLGVQPNSNESNDW